MKGSDVTKKVELEMKLKNEQMRIHIEKDWNDLLLNELHDKKRNSKCNFILLFRLLIMSIFCT